MSCMKERTGKLSFIGHPMRLCLYFAAHPEARLTTLDISEMLNIPLKSVCATMGGALHAELVGREIGGGRDYTIYFAGPSLLASIEMQKPPETPEVSRVTKPVGSWERKEQGLAPATWMAVVA